MPREIELDLSLLRQTHRIRQSKLAQQLQVPQSTLSRWEKGERSIPLEDAVALALALTKAKEDDPVTVQDIYNAWQVAHKRFLSQQEPAPDDPSPLDKAA